MVTSLCYAILPANLKNKIRIPIHNVLHWAVLIFVLFCWFTVYIKFCYLLVFSKMPTWNQIQSQLRNPNNPVVFFDISVGATVSRPYYKALPVFIYGTEF